MNSYLVLERARMLRSGVTRAMNFEQNTLQEKSYLAANSVFLHLFCLKLPIKSNLIFNGWGSIVKYPSRGVEQYIMNAKYSPPGEMFKTKCEFDFARMCKV
jgi:hypothetical protein